MKSRSLTILSIDAPVDYIIFKLEEWLKNKEEDSEEVVVVTEAVVVAVVVAAGVAVVATRARTSGCL